MAVKVAKCVKVDGCNKYLPIPLVVNKPYVVLEENADGNDQYIKIKMGKEAHVFHKTKFKIV